MASLQTVPAELGVGGVTGSLDEVTPTASMTDSGTWDTAVSTDPATGENVSVLPVSFGVLA